MIWAKETMTAPATQWQRIRLAWHGMHRRNSVLKSIRVTIITAEQRSNIPRNVLISIFHCIFGDDRGNGGCGDGATVAQTLNFRGTKPKHELYHPHDIYAIFYIRKLAKFK